MYVKSHLCVHLDKERYVDGGDLMVFCLPYILLCCLLFFYNEHTLFT